MNIKKAIIPLMLFMGGIAFGQLTVKGRFVDQNKMPLKKVAVRLLRAGDSAEVKSASSKRGGDFILEAVLPGDFILKYTVKGQKPEFIDFDSDGPLADLGTIVIFPAARSNPKRK